MFKSNGPILILTFMLVIVLCYRCLHSRLQHVSHRPSLEKFDLCLQEGTETFRIQNENILNTFTSFFSVLKYGKTRNFDICRNNNCLLYLCILVVSVSGDIHSNPGPNSLICGNSVYPCGVCEANVTWSRNAVYCETCGIWFHIDCQD